MRALVIKVASSNLIGSHVAGGLLNSRAEAQRASGPFTTSAISVANRRECGTAEETHRSNDEGGALADHPYDVMKNTVYIVHITLIVMANIFRLYILTINDIICAIFQRFYRSRWHGYCLDIATSAQSARWPSRGAMP